jgi:hypothetical protein
MARMSMSRNKRFERPAPISLEEVIAVMTVKID